MWVCLVESDCTSSVGWGPCKVCAVGLEVKEGRPRSTVRRASSRLEDKRSSWEQLLGAVGWQGKNKHGTQSDLERKKEKERIDILQLSNVPQSFGILD